MHVFIPSFLSLKANSKMPEKYKIRSVFDQVCRPQIQSEKAIVLKPRTKNSNKKVQNNSQLFTEIRSKSALEKRFKRTQPDNVQILCNKTIAFCQIGEIKLIHSKKLTQEQLRSNIKSKTTQSRNGKYENSNNSSPKTSKAGNRPFLMTKTLQFHEREDNHQNQTIRSIKITDSRADSRIKPINGASGIRIKFKKLVKPELAEYRPWSPTKNQQDQQWPL